MLPKDAQDLAELRERLVSDLNRLATMELLDRNWEAARKSLDKLADLAPKDETVLSNRRYLDRQMEIQRSIAETETLFQARVLVENGQHERATSLLEDFLHHSPEHEEARRLREKAAAGSGIILSYHENRGLNYVSVATDTPGVLSAPRPISYDQGENKASFTIRLSLEEEEDETTRAKIGTSTEVPDTEPEMTPLERMRLAVERNPTDAHAHHVLAAGYYHSGDRERALAHYEKASELAPGDTDILRTLADFYYAEAGRVEDAVEVYEAILAESPEDVDVLTILGHIHLGMENQDDARFYYEKALALNPDDERIREFLNGIAHSANN